MRKYFLNTATVIVAFSVGVTSNAPVNGACDLLIDQYHTASSLAKATVAWEEPRLVGPHVNRCGLVITLKSNGTLFLNNEQRGTLNNPAELLDRLRSIFEVRLEQHVYKAGVEATSPIPEEDRIEKTVYIKASPEISFGKVSDLIEALKEVKADPIVLLAGLVDI